METEDARALVYKLIDEERARQTAKWGDQEENKKGTWLAILMEEVGELATAILNHDQENYKEELIQIAAVSVAILEKLEGEEQEPELPAIAPFQIWKDPDK
jgi:NTP pyrophosphatase (non-canonical NTP hydrolase)